MTSYLFFLTDVYIVRSILVVNFDLFHKALDGFKCFMVLSFLINLIAIPAMGFSCLIDLMWGICNDWFL